MVDLYIAGVSRKATVVGIARVGGREKSGESRVAG